MKTASRIAMVLALASAIGAAQDLKSYSARVERNLKGNIIPFWFPRSVDERNGGYLVGFDANGQTSGKTDKMIVTQARMLWFFSRLAREGYETPRMLAAADAGWRFLQGKMLDKKNGGYYWEVDVTGDRHLMPDKHLYGQSFALYALSEYALASKKPEVLAAADALFQTLEQRAHDAQYGGYQESFREDWTLLKTGSSYMGPVQYKLMNTHLHLLESMTAYYRASHSPLALQRLVELIGIESNAVVRKNVMGCTDKYSRDWQPDLTDGYARVSYGHDLENIWLLIDACKAANLPTYPFTDLFKAIFANAREFGFDATNGGFFETGAFHAKADGTDKVWWVQAEACVSALYMYRLTHDPGYLQVFAKTYDFVDKYQTDWKHGEWWNIVRDGQGTGEKGQIWKAAYHNGRAMLECLALLKEIDR
jgi:cellobiose epimerase